LKSAERRNVKIEVLDGSNLTDARFDVMGLMRRMVCEELDLPCDAEMEASVESSSLHLLCSQGDSPVAVMRWCYVQREGAWGMQVDRILCLGEYRLRAYAYRSLCAALSYSQAHHVPVQFITAVVPLPCPQRPQLVHLCDRLAHIGFIIGTYTPLSLCYMLLICYMLPTFYMLPT
jgi:hypothetical protein